RINAPGDGPIAMQWGGSEDSGPPGYVHTFSRYVPREEWFASHPEWFAWVNDARQPEGAQLCLSNDSLRQHFRARLIDHVRLSRLEAERENRPRPHLFDISQNDSHGMCECDRCLALVRQHGAPSGALIDFLNSIAPALGENKEGLAISTLAYLDTADPPRDIALHPSLTIRLCDTRSNLLLPVTHPENRLLFDRIRSWRRLAHTLQVWDYAVHFGPAPGLPLPTHTTYASDLRYFAEHNVEGVIIEQGDPVLADFRDLKLWLQAKLLEDPERDERALIEDFLNGYYGSAARWIRRYLDELRLEAERTRSAVDWHPTLAHFRYLNTRWLARAQQLFDSAERNVRKDAVRLARVRFARLPIDRATLLLWPRLTRAWRLAGNKIESFPLDRAAIGARTRATWLAAIHERVPASQHAQAKENAIRDMAWLTTLPAFVPIPARFQDHRGRDVFDHLADQARCDPRQAALVPAPTTESGHAVRFEWKDESAAKRSLPWTLGVFDRYNSRAITTACLTRDQIPGPGFHWYRLGATTLTESAFLYFFADGLITMPLDDVYQDEAAQDIYDIWAHIQFEGPAFLPLSSAQTNAVSIERVVLLRRAQSPVSGSRPE
ncbi:MAG: DUF4838 domain-containing protein, partial [Vicinamibacteria bacterium]|nr:DUF4838 domain-containing protein [Vicinamibacteria bacterium]